MTCLMDLSQCPLNFYGSGHSSGDLINSEGLADTLCYQVELKDGRMDNHTKQINAIIELILLLLNKFRNDSARKFMSWYSDKCRLFLWHTKNWPLILLDIKNWNNTWHLHHSCPNQQMWKLYKSTHQLNMQCLSFILDVEEICNQTDWSMCGNKLSFEECVRKIKIKMNMK